MEILRGKWCVVYRGACFFQTKWEMCHAAGAIGTILVTLDDSAGSGWMMWGKARIVRHSHAVSESQASPRQWLG